MTPRLPLVLALLLPACTDRPIDGSATGSPSTTDATIGATTGDPPTSTSGQPTTTVGETTVGETTAGETTVGETTTDEPGTSTSSSSTSTGSTSTASTSDGASTGLPDEACDIWTQNCPEGQKCAPVSLDGESGKEAAACRPVVDDPDALGGPCTVLGTSAEGLDTCPEGQFCWRWNLGSPAGTCLALCTGGPDDPKCPEAGLQCVLDPLGVENLCIRPCNPLMQDCHDGDVCVPNEIVGQGFMCLDDASGAEGQVFDDCHAINGCDPGLQCGSKYMISECQGDPEGNCCMPYCDVTIQPDECPGGNACSVWYSNAPGQENVGVCGWTPI